LIISKAALYHYLKRTIKAAKSDFKNSKITKKKNKKSYLKKFRERPHLSHLENGTTESKNERNVFTRLCKKYVVQTKFTW